VPSESQNDRALNNILVYGFSLAFGLVIASLQALRSTPSGFAILISGWTLLALLFGAALTFPCFWVIVRSRSHALRRGALTLVSLLGLGAFFYPMRVVPREKYTPVFIGLFAAVTALSVVAGLLLMLHRFFERDEKRNEIVPGPSNRVLGK
jgi:hypothetical protein